MNHTHDIIIIGGGLSGLTLAAALGHQPLNIAVIEKGDLTAQIAPAFDGRVSAIAAGSKALFEQWQVWQHLAPHAGAINDIRITDNHSPLFLHFDHRNVGDEPMGYILENRHLRMALMEQLQTYDNVTILDNVQYEQVQADAHSVLVALEDGEQLSAPLMVVAEGRFSGLREQLGINVRKVQYHQTAIVATIKHEEPHHGLAVEAFLPSGPFAILPMQDANHSSIVWTEKTALAELYLAMEEAPFLEAIQQRFGDFLGSVSLVGERFGYPLSLQYASQYIHQRTALIGDAVHAIHPIAGQGFNLSMRDIASLSELIAQDFRAGMDIGRTSLLQAYQQSRKLDNGLMIAATDGFNRLFSNDNKSLGHLRRVGLKAVEELPYIKPFFIEHAMGKNRIIH